MKKAKKKVALTMRSLDAVDADGKEVDEATSKMASALGEVGLALKELKQARKKQKTHTGQARKHTQGASDALEEDMEWSRLW